MSAVGRAAHGIDDVFVETGEESEPVLTREWETAVHAGIRDRDTAGLAAEHSLALVYTHPKTTLSEFLRRA